MVGQVDLSQVLRDEAMVNNNIQDQKKTSALLHLVLSCLALLWMNICIYNYKLLLDLCSVVWMLCLEITGHAIFNHKLIVNLSSHNLISILTWLDRLKHFEKHFATVHPFPSWDASDDQCSDHIRVFFRLQFAVWWGYRALGCSPKAGGGGGEEGKASQGNPQACKFATQPCPQKNPPPGRKHYQKYSSTISKTEINSVPIKLKISV